MFPKKYGHLWGQRPQKEQIQPPKCETLLRTEGEDQDAPWGETSDLKTMNSAEAEAALQHLRRRDQGYSIERRVTADGVIQVQLKRRNIPVRDESFSKIVLDQKAGHVVGIRTKTPREGRGVVLVDKQGRPVANGASVAVRMEDVATAATASRRGVGGGGSRATLSDEDNKMLLTCAGLCVGVLVAARIIATAATLPVVCLLPLLYMYLLSNCPSTESFDAKKEIKRVMRGHHPPKERQPRGLFEQGLNRLAATVTTELATSLGYEMETMEFGGAATFMSVKVPVAGAEYYWLGIAGESWQGEDGLCTFVSGISSSISPAPPTDRQVEVRGPARDR